MDITPPLPAGTNYISAYSDEGIRIGEEWIFSPVIISTNNLTWLEELGSIFAQESYSKIIEVINAHKTSSKVILLVGTGRTHYPAPPALIAFLSSYNISPEFMTTHSACRTYNVLVTEQRDVFALLTM